MIYSSCGVIFMCMLRTAFCVALRPGPFVPSRAAHVIAPASLAFASVVCSSSLGSVRLAKPKSRSLHMSTSHLAPLWNVMSHVRSPQALRRRPLIAPIFSNISS